MSYKFKPNKGVAKRVRVTKSGKLKHSHELNSHLRSNRSPAKKRHLGRPSVLDETQAKRLRSLLGISGRRPNQAAHRKALNQKAVAEAK